MHLNVQFYKYQGAGNDFVMIDDRDCLFDAKNAKLIEWLCDRRFGIGADGLILLQLADGYDFRMVYFNSDGYEATMCGNGARCIVAFAGYLGFIGAETHFLAADGEHHAMVCSDGDIDLQLADVEKIELFPDGYLLDTGVPHFVKFVDKVDAVNVNAEGRELRFDQRFGKAGANVNFVQQTNHGLTVYTYERGVECETLACGTGVTASALSAAYKTGMRGGIFPIQAKGGKLSVRFNFDGAKFNDVWLKGPAKLVFQGKIDFEETFLG